jgi:hypothetical protein
MNIRKRNTRVYFFPGRFKLVTSENDRLRFFSSTPFTASTGLNNDEALDLLSEDEVNSEDSGLSDLLGVVGSFGGSFVFRSPNSESKEANSKHAREMTNYAKKNSNKSEKSRAQIKER